MIAKRPLPAGTDALAAWRALARDPGRVALDSAAEGPGTGRWSIVASRPLARVVWRETAIEVVANGSVILAVPLVATAAREGSADAFTAVREVLAWFRADATHDLEGLPFAGGAIGWFSYELGRRLVPQKFTKPRADADPPLELALYGGAILVDRQTGEAWAVGCDTALGRGEDEVKRLYAAIAETGIRTNPQARIGEAPSAGRRPTPPWHEQTSHRDAVATVRRYIEAGDIYQANVSARFEATCTKTADELWPALRATSPEPFAACLDGVDRTVLSASMERLLSVHGRAVETRPIKGTRPRGASAADDERMRRELASSEKDSAELLMIVDLHRNDLGKVCRPGSIVVPTLFGVRTFARVHHLEATITGQLRDGMDALDALRALFPAGSITGAPKIRAMQVLEEVEPTPRGVYCGAIGYLGLDGSADFAVAIRTAVLNGGILRWSAGGGIVWDSDPTDEWREVLAKSAGFQALLQD